MNRLGARTTVYDLLLTWYIWILSVMIALYCVHGYLELQKFNVNGLKQQNAPVVEEATGNET